ncbi:hypothetical protein TNIN_411841 [Trichonephila inaurata madagascariensis]|uniref:Uncharacterized protein n=1 Tax=Trichonephila inaurata madagascariensis TaxID=2747483 RepID=A0A8X6X1G2_9ARAC|nr:hypothetical protein TNIN_411841 [Trichonephila inaurata madagascariensis]
MCNQLTEQARPAFENRVDRRSCFKLYGHVTDITDENPRVIITTKLIQTGVPVWGDISCHGVVGPDFFERTVDGPRNLDMLIEVVVTQLQAWPDSASGIVLSKGRSPTTLFFGCPSIPGSGIPASLNGETGGH